MKKSAKALVILQLCITFITLCSYGLAPFMQELYTYRSRLFLAQTVLGSEDLLAYAPQEKMKLKAMKALAKQLPEPDRVRIQEDAAHYQRKLNNPFISKLGRSISILFKELPLLILAQLCLALLISFALLYSIEGAQQAAWILPILSLVILFDNTLRPVQPPTPEELYYPKVKEIEALGVGSSAKERFQTGWNSWLVNNWAEKAPPHQDALIRAEFALSHALLKAHRDHPTYHKAALYNMQRPMPFLVLIFGWNLIFGLLITRKDIYEDPTPLDCTHHSL
jgi:hypothetical protein